jgi:hypothetical protein
MAARSVRESTRCHAMQSFVFVSHSRADVMHLKYIVITHLEPRSTVISVANEAVSLMRRTYDPVIRPVDVI